MTHSVGFRLCIGFEHAHLIARGSSGVGVQYDLCVGELVMNV